MVPKDSDRTERTDLSDQADKTDTSDSRELLPNLWVMDVPLERWQTHKIDWDIRTKDIDVIIWNSFEFSAMGRGKRERIAKEMVELREATNVSVVIFSHEMKKDIEPHTPARGAIGLVAPYADTVWRLDVPGENGKELPEEVLNLRNDAVSAEVHEEKTRTSQLDQSQDATDTSAACEALAVNLEAVCSPRMSGSLEPSAIATALEVKNLDKLPSWQRIGT